MIWLLTELRVSTLPHNVEQVFLRALNGTDFGAGEAGGLKCQPGKPMDAEVVPVNPVREAQFLTRPVPGRCAHAGQNDVGSAGVALRGGMKMVGGKHVSGIVPENRPKLFGHGHRTTASAKHDNGLRGCQQPTEQVCEKSQRLSEDPDRAHVRAGCDNNFASSAAQVSHRLGEVLHGGPDSMQMQDLISANDYHHHFEAHPRVTQSRDLVREVSGFGAHYRHISELNGSSGCGGKPLGQQHSDGVIGILGTESDRQRITEDGQFKGFPIVFTTEQP